MVSPQTSISDFIMRIAAEENLPADRMQGIAKKLADEWYDTVDSMKHVTIEQLTTMGIPSRVASAIIRKLKTIETAVPVSRASLLDLLARELGKSEALQECIRTLQAIVYNILVNPHDLRLREIRVTNVKFRDRVGRIPTAMSYLDQIGFKPQGDCIRLSNPSIALITESLKELNSYGTRLGLPEKIPSHMVEPEQFNPYKAVTTWCDPSMPKLLGRENDPTVYMTQIEELEKAKMDFLRQERVERCPQVYRLSEGTTAQSIRRRNEILEQATEDADTPEDESLMLQTMQSLLRTNEENSRFQNKRKKMLEQLSRRKVFTKVTIQVRFPDSTLVQANFSPLETNVDLYKFVHELLEQRSKKFYLYFTPPKVKIELDRMQKLESMAPASLAYFAWEQEEETTANDGPFLKGETLQRAVAFQ